MEPGSESAIEPEDFALFDQLPSGIAIIDEDYTIRFWNRCLEYWTGRKREGLLQKNILEEFPSLRQPSVIARFPQVFSGETPVYFSSRFHPHLIPSLLPDGSLRVEKGSVLPVKRAGKILAMVVIEDVTDLNIQVTGLHRMRVIAENELAERKKAEESLRTANAKLSLFSDVTIQDIRNQLVAARGFNHMIGHSLEDLDRIRMFSAKIDRQLEIIEKYVSLILDFEPLGKEPPRWYAMRDAIDQAKLLAQFPDVIEGPEIEGLEIYAPPLLDRIMANFLDNAKRHGRTATEVRISFLPEDSSGTLVIEDNGQGVPADKKEYIFGKGLGTKTKLSLYHTRELLAITGISIRETGVDGKGTRFELRIPGDCFRTGPGVTG
ncbi:ATP-binding protein [Methanoregula sp. UBA64]|uniref:ATP-binding protein n=1 Tax=Methanoregula sp. UBA64 TaxID=1915554 RepID=UPI0025D8474F|nr:PAS domain-containing sensor histidine kinase [Methanoregula sp. UBA64]